MSTKHWSQLKTVSPAYQRIKEQGLMKHLEELEAYGLAVIPPEKIGGDRLMERMRAAILRIAEERTGIKHDIETGEHGTLIGEGTNNSQYLLFTFFEEDPVFEEIVQHKMTLPLIEYYLGEDCQLSSLTSFIKWQDPVGYGPTLGMHDDSALYRGPVLPAVGVHKCNTNWILTDYTKDNGAFCIIPGSHKLCRHPKPMEGVEDAVPVEAPAGSVLIFHGNVWHGAFPRNNPGLRLSVNADYCGRHYRIQENFQGRLSEELLARYDDRFRQLMNYDDTHGWQEKFGPVRYQLRKNWESLSDREKRAVINDQIKR